MLRLIFRPGVVVAVGAVILIVASFGVGALLNVPTLSFIAEDGFAAYDPLRGINLWRDLDIDRFNNIAFNQDQSRIVVASTSGGQSAEVRIYSLPEGQLLCAQTVENTSYLSFTYGWYGEEFNDRSLLMHNNLVLFHLEVPTCTVMEIGHFENRIQFVLTSDRYAVVRIGKPDDQHELHLIDLTTGEQRLIAETGSSVPNVVWYWSWDSQGEMRPDSRWLLYNSDQGFHVYETATGEQQTISEAGSFAYWAEPDLIIITPTPGLSVSAFSIYSFVDGQVGERVFHEPLAYMSPTGYFSGYWDRQRQQLTYAAVDSRSAAPRPYLVRYEHATGTTARLLPEYDDIEYASPLNENLLLINRRDDALPTLALDLNTGEVRELAARTEGWLYWSLNPSEGIYLSNADNMMTYWNTVEHRQQQIAQFDQTVTILHGEAERGYVAMVMQQGGGVCLYLIDGRSARQVYCHQDYTVRFWWRDN